ncbi:hypothetical protein H7142_03190, partial [Candidatus Saccharibacteria bacterium]|nr:hypothetical protein [Candidatus Saccharibacteria bacterium]
MRNFSGSSDQTALSGKGYTIAPDGYLRSHGVPSVRQAGVPETPTLAEQDALPHHKKEGG